MNLFRRRPRVVQALAGIALVADAGIAAARLTPQTVSGWTSYVQQAEARRVREAHNRNKFLAMDFAPEAAADRRAVLAGSIVVRHMESGSGGAGVDVPAGMVHHWRGAIFLPKQTVAGVLNTLQFGAPPARQDDVLSSHVISRGPDWVDVYLRLQRTKIVTVVYDTEHHVTFTRYDDVRAASASTATKIAEVANAGTASEHQLPVGEDRGFLWRLNAYWRYQAVPGGVIAECESITLSRGLPGVIAYLASPLIERAARESMERTLLALRAKIEEPSPRRKT